jgi:5'(3')-deoxyribonucleotidase
MVVGVDLDGVVGDQLAGVLPRVAARLGLDLTPEDVTEFRLPIGDSDIAEEIKRAQRDPSYILEMPVFPGAQAMVAALRSHARVIAVTARPAATIAATIDWIERNGLEFDDVVIATEGRKSLHGADVLVDDFVGNIVEFLAASTGNGPTRAVLVDRPWNRRDRRALEEWVASGRCDVAYGLEDVPRFVLGQLPGTHTADRSRAAI